MELDNLHGMHISCLELVVKTADIGSMYFYIDLACNSIKKSGVYQLACIKIKEDGVERFNRLIFPSLQKLILRNYGLNEMVWRLIGGRYRLCRGRLSGLYWFDFITQ